MRLASALGGVASLACLVAGVGCAHTDRGDGATAFGQRVGAFRQLLATFPACAPAAIGSTDMVAAPGAQATIVGTLEMTIDACVARAAVLAGSSGAGRQCRPCDGPAYDWRLIPSRAPQDEVLLSMPSVLQTGRQPMDCDDRAFATARGARATVMITGRLGERSMAPSASTSPGSEALLIGMTSPRRMEVEAICRVTPPAQ